jgi:hypothetical protein
VQVFVLEKKVVKRIYIYIYREREREREGGERGRERKKERKEGCENCVLRSFVVCKVHFYGETMTTARWVHPYIAQGRWEIPF